MTPESMMASAMSPNLRLNEEVSALRLAGLDILHLGFGEARLPLLPELAQVFCRAATRTGYAPVAGTQTARAAVARWFERRQSPTLPEQIVLGPGTKPLLFAAMASAPGEIYMGAPSWNSYAPQACLAGGHPSAIPIGRQGGAPEPGPLRAQIERDSREGRTPSAIVINSPDNPTGTHVGPDVLRELCQIARDWDLQILSDEIYSDLGYPDSDCFGVTPLAPERTLTFAGLSKSLAIGGWRIGAVRFPEGASALRQRVISIASDTWSCMPAPMQEVAAYAFDDPAPVRNRLAQSRKLYAALAQSAYSVCRSHGAEVRWPTGAFYLYVDLGTHRDRLASKGIVDSRSLARVLLEQHRIAVLDGAALGDDPAALTFKIATTGFVGNDEPEQWEALRSQDPGTVPHIAARFSRLDEALRSLLEDGACTPEPFNLAGSRP